MTLMVVSIGLVRAAVAAILMKMLTNRRRKRSTPKWRRKMARMPNLISMKMLIVLVTLMISVVSGHSMTSKKTLM